jgi:hypothetical protein
VGAKPPSPGPKPLDELAGIANERAAVHKTVPLLHDAIAAGEALIEARRMIGHGGWLAWVEANLDMHMSTVNNYMRIAHHQEALAAKRITSYTVAKDWMRGWPGPFDARKPGYDERVRQAALAMLEAGEPQRTVADALGVSRSTVRNWQDPAEAERRRVANRERRRRNARRS